MGQFVHALRGIGEACKALDMPIVSGNVSLYNETDGQAILPTPTIGAVGLIATAEGMIGGTAQDGDLALVVGETLGHLGQSAVLAEALGREDGPPPPVDLDAERRNGDFLLENNELISAATDLSDGGLALAAFELAEKAGLGVTLDVVDTPTLFGEDQARYLLSCSFDCAEALMVAAGQAGVPVTAVGRFGGEAYSVGAERAAMSELREIWHSAVPKALDV